MRLVWTWEPTAAICGVVAIVLGLFMLRTVAWMNSHHILTWTDLLTWRRRFRRYNEALARGGVPCRCNWGRTYHERRTQSPDPITGTLLYVTTRPCVHCCGIGAILPQPQPTLTMR